MKTPSLLALAAIALSQFAIAQDSEIREFTSLDGKKIKAKVVAIDDGEVTIKREDGEKFTIAGSKFSKADQDYFRSWKPTPIKMLPLNKVEPVTMPERDINVVGLDKKEADARYNSEVEAAGDLVNDPPVIRLEGQRLSVPTRSNGVYKVRFEATNLSRHPTEVNVEFTIVGQAKVEGANPIYQMKKVKETWKLRKSEVRVIEVSVPAAPKTYKGYTMVATFKDKVVSATGSHTDLQKIASNGNSIPLEKPKK